MKFAKALRKPSGILSWSKVTTGVVGGTSLGAVIVILCFSRNAFTSVSEGGGAAADVDVAGMGWSSVVAGVEGSEDSSFRFFFSFLSFFLSLEDEPVSADSDSFASDQGSEKFKAKGLSRKYSPS